MKIFISLLAVCILGAVFIFGQKTESSFYPPLKYSESGELNNVPLKLAVADTDEERKNGLSGQTELKGEQGLLFIFTHVDRHGIWMKDMNFPIDILWLDENKQVISIRESFSPESFPEVAYPSVPASFVLELSSGFAAEHKISIGDELLFSLEVTP
jgi:uncharacterized membrane protein (UPF0127 family)